MTQSVVILTPPEVHLLGKLLCPTLGEALGMDKVLDDEGMPQLLDRLATLISPHIGQGMSASIVIETYTGLPGTPPKREPCWAILGNVPVGSTVKCPSSCAVTGHPSPWYTLVTSMDKAVHEMQSREIVYVTEWADA